MSKCVIQKQGELMGEPYKTKYFDLLNKRPDQGGLANSRLANELKKLGLKASEGGISKHRNLACVCGGMEL